MFVGPLADVYFENLAFHFLSCSPAALLLLFGVELVTIADILVKVSENWQTIISFMKMLTLPDTHLAQNAS